ncbi:MAG TPA: flavodoxin family protein [Candidatus Limnocylindrales bacterium]
MSVGTGGADKAAAGEGQRTAVVVYRSATGTTRRYAEAIGAHLASRGLAVTVRSVGDCEMTALPTADFVLFGCWTSGLFVVGQHPDRPWLDFARDLPRLERPRIGLFTTYKLLTGSMFGRMRERLAGRTAEPELELKSRDGSLSPADRGALDRFVGLA